MDKYTIPRSLDEPFKIMLWTLDELCVLFIPFLILMFFFNSPITGLIVGALLLFILKKLKGEQGHFFLHHLLYWYLPPLFYFKKTPPSYRREWIA
jgi:conjugal transfer pilus assembly protein TraL